MKHKCVFGTYGIHPHEAKSHQHIKASDIIKKVDLNKKVIGIGETGLDFYYNHSEKNDQINCFEEHIYAAQEKIMPTQEIKESATAPRKLIFKSKTTRA